VIARRLLPLLGIVLAASLSACQPADRAHVVEVTARDFAFDAPDQIPSGWTTFRMTNAGEQEHFLYIYRLPENKT